ncbi:lipoprotein-releasing ABC transporter permease subunit [Halomonas elongata]|uniref:ABC-type lipoprotein-releasing system transmembrane protein LolC n=2 Tax=Halomonas elongata TaxID=2746 RepID=E1V9M6_HALED|nr:lipoprotein-releasing ABC transporter permease subunit [Halomonas elongata]MBW5798567.1 lipoprotein-releasing ABC transporter permease subunit [Halomonas elongata]MDL4863870.1 lipoprotein-releasing ABC transporter permease subunit [Halomonas elongata]OBX37212.1 lipoprotein-releasing system transmembrane protein LolE [Halomonas elongata]RAW08185.1 lipoprotein-releasing ABC transporter permease subunit [Halomonas elongata]WBF19103.1 lipoprotein-releasing ABC transporter permease subunit [Halo
MLDRLPLLIGLRYVRAKRRNHFISFISLTSMLGLTLGVAVLILVLSVMNGFDRELRTRILGMVPHTQIEKPSGMTDWQSLAERLTQREHVIGAAPYIEQQGMFSVGGRNHGAMVNGIEPDWERRVSIIDEHMSRGSLDDLVPGEWNVVLGSILARQLGVGVGDSVTLLVPEASITPAGVFPRLKRFTVSGIFSVGADLDANLAYANIEDMQTLARMGDDVGGLRLELDDLFKAGSVTQSIIDDLGAGYRGLDWTYTRGNLFQAIQMEKRMIALLLTVIIAVAAFNIVSTLVMVVTDKHADIAILRTIGATPRSIMGIFMVQGLAIGVIGILIGVGLGILLALTVSDIIAFVESTFGIHFLDAGVYFISELPSQLLWSDVGKIVVSAFVLTFLSTLYPAWRAARVQPAEVLRYE